MDLSFPKSRRLRTTRDFQRVYDARMTASDERLIVYAAANNLGYPRLGVSVSRKAGNAVVRNRYKRLFREAFRQLQPELPAMDFVLLPRTGTLATQQDYRESLKRLAERFPQ